MLWAVTGHMRFLGVDEVQEDLGRNLTYGLQEILGRAIVVGEFAERPFPSEADILNEHGISRSVAREAIKMLTAKGLLSSRPKQGSFVRPEESWNLFDTDVLRWLLDRPVSIGLLRQFNELRVAVEPEAAALAAGRASSGQLEAIRRGLDRMRVAEKGLDDALDADIAFHVAVLRASGNPFFIQFRDMVGTALRVSIRFTNRISGRTGNIDEHEVVYNAIAAGNGDLARSSMRSLIGDVLLLIDHAEQPE